jgi:hypothetical protein
MSYPHLKGRGPFIDRAGSTNYGLVTIQPELSYMVSGAPNFECRFIEVGWGFPGVLLSSLALWWMVPRKVLGDVIAVLGFTWLLSLPT